jgi:outer membrane protein
MFLGEEICMNPRNEMQSRIRSGMRKKNLKPFVYGERSRTIIRHSSLVIFCLSLSILFLLLLPSFTFSQEGKIGYVDSKRLRAEFKDFQDAQGVLDQNVKEWQDEVAQSQKVIDSLKADSAKVSLLLTEAKRKEKDDSLAVKRLEHERLINDIFGPDGRLEKKNEELTKPILDKINLVLEKIATEGNFIMIFDSVNGNIAYAKKSLDLTDQVLEELKKLQ